MRSNIKLRVIFFLIKLFIFNYAYSQNTIDELNYSEFLTIIKVICTYKPFPGIGNLVKRNPVNTKKYVIYSLKNYKLINDSSRMYEDSLQLNKICIMAYYYRNFHQSLELIDEIKKYADSDYVEKKIKLTQDLDPIIYQGAVMMSGIGDSLTYNTQKSMRNLVKNGLINTIYKLNNLHTLADYVYDGKIVVTAGGTNPQTEIACYLSMLLSMAGAFHDSDSILVHNVVKRSNDYCLFFIGDGRNFFNKRKTIMISSMLMWEDNKTISFDSLITTLTDTSLVGIYDAYRTFKYTYIYDNFDEMTTARLVKYISSLDTLLMKIPNFSNRIITLSAFEKYINSIKIRAKTILDNKLKYDSLSFKKNENIPVNPRINLEANILSDSRTTALKKNNLIIHKSIIPKNNSKRQVYQERPKHIPIFIYIICLINIPIFILLIYRYLLKYNRINKWKKRKEFE